MNQPRIPGACALALAFGAALASAPIRAQHRTVEQRERYYIDRTFVASTGVRATLSSHAFGGETAYITLQDASSDAGTWTPAPFEIPGGADAIGSPGIGLFLLCGTSGLRADPPAPTGTIALVLADLGSSPIVLETISLPAKDLLAVCWVDALDTLFVLDGSNNEVLGASWTGPGAPLPTAAAFQTVFTTSELPLLDSIWLHMEPLDQGIRIVEHSPFIGVNVIRSQGSWITTVYDPRSGNGSTPAFAWRVAAARAVPANANLAIDLAGGSDPTAFELVTVIDDQVVTLATGTHPGTGTLHLPPPPYLFEQPGALCVLRGGEARPVQIRSRVHYGGAVSTPALQLDGDLFVPSAWCTVGSDGWFGLRARLKRSATAASTHQAFLLIGARTSDGDPILDLGDGTSTLSDPAVTLTSLDFAADQTERGFRQAVAIPADDALVGQVVLFQLAFDDGSGGLAYTSVQATTILGADQNPIAQRNPSLTANRGGEAPDKRRREAVRGWLYGDLTGLGDPRSEATRRERARSELVERIHARMRAQRRS